MDIIVKLTEEFGVKKVQIEQAVKLIDEGNTVPFIARYRKYVTGGLNASCHRRKTQIPKRARGTQTGGSSQY